jgi:hypothetical protein
MDKTKEKARVVDLGESGSKTPNVSNINTKPSCDVHFDALATSSPGVRNPTVHETSDWNIGTFSYP